MPRPPVKKTMKLAMAAKLGELKATEKFRLFLEKKEDKDIPKTLTRLFKEKMSKAIDRIDPLKAIAIVGTTYMVHGAIIGDESLYQKLFGMVKLQTGMYWPHILIEPFEWLFPTKPWEAEKEKSPQDMQSIMFGWLISFAIAYLLVEHGGELIGMLGKGFSGLLTLLFA